MKQAGFAKYAFLGISVVIILAALGVLFYLTNSSKKMAVKMQLTPTETTVQATPTPVITPLTQADAQPTIDATEQDMQQALNQANTDLQAENQISSSQDNTTGL